MPQKKTQEARNNALCGKVLHPLRNELNELATEMGKRKLPDKENIVRINTRLAENNKG